MTTKKYMSLERLQEYDILIKQEIDKKIDDVSSTVSDLSNTTSTNYNESIIGLSVDGQVITYIKGDGSTRTFETQDTNTEYFLATDEVTGLTKLYATVGNAEDGTMTQKAIKTELDSKVNTSDLNAHINNKSNPHGVTLSQLGVTATAAELNYVDGVTSNVQTQLNKKADDFSIEIYNGTSGNPKPVKFLTVNYSTCSSEAGVAIKLGMVSGHGNGSSYAFLQDAIIKVTHTGVVSVDNFKYYGAETTLDGARQYGDIFWIIDTTNKIVDFYCLMGQYARLQMTPYKRVTYSTGGTITQYTSCTVYSSGTMSWANNSDIALMSDLSSLDTRLTALESSVVTTHSGDQEPISELGEDGDIYLITG